MVPTETFQLLSAWHQIATVSDAIRHISIGAPNPNGSGVVPIALTDVATVKLNRLKVVAPIAIALFGLPMRLFHIRGAQLGPRHCDPSAAVSTANDLKCSDIDVSRAAWMTPEGLMRFRWMTILLLSALGGCSWLTGAQEYSVYFRPYSSELDPQARETIQDAADFARKHPLQAVVVSGFSAPPDPKLNVDSLSAQRAEAVEQMLTADGVGPSRITTVANGITDPKTLPRLAVRRVDISIGH